MRFSRLGLSALVLIGLFIWMWSPERRSRPDLDPPAVVAQIQQLNQLTTVRYTVQKVIGLTEQKQPVGAESILLILQANVQAGINLAALQPRDVRIAPDGTVELRLPAAQIVDATIDEKETKVWDRQKTWWTPWIPFSKDLEQRARVEGLESAKQAAISMGILKQAERNAETSIRSLLGLVGVKSVVIIPASVS